MQDVKGQYFFTIRASNEQLLLTSPFYTVKDTAMSRITSSRSLGRRDSNYLVCSTADGQYYFYLRNQKREILGSSTVYSNRESMEKDLDTLKKCVKGTRVVDLTWPCKTVSAPEEFHSPQPIKKRTATTSRIILTRNITGQYLFTFRASDGQLLLTSPCLPDKDTALYHIHVTRNLAQMDWCYQIRSAGGGQYYFEFKNNQGEILGRSTVYSNGQSMQKGIDLLKSCAKPSRLLDLTGGE